MHSWECLLHVCHHLCSLGDDTNSIAVMFERYLADALATHFGHIIDNLDHNNIAVSAWKGGLILKNVFLRKSALDTIVLSPLEIAYGKVGTLNVRIPWKLVRGYLFRGSSDSSDLSLSLELSDVTVLVLPKAETVDTELPQHEKDEIREKIAAGILEANLLQRLSTAAVKTDRSKDLLANLSITVKDIHIRYEDTGDCLGFRKNDGVPYRPPFAIGLMLKEFSLKNGTSPDNKIASAADLAIYWDSDVKVMSSRSGDTSYYAQCFEQLRHMQHEFLLDPLSMSIALVFASKGAHGTITAELPSCRLSVYKSLLEDGGYLRRSFSLWMNEMMGLGGETLSRLSRLRPSERPDSNPTGWWHFLISAVIAVNANKKRKAQNAKFDPDSEIAHRSKGWVGFVKAYHRRKQYCGVLRVFAGASEEYREKLHEELIILERGLLVDEIAAFRMHFFEHYTPEEDAQILDLMVPISQSPEHDTPQESSDDEPKPDFSPELTSTQRLRSFVQVLTTLKEEEQNSIIVPKHTRTSRKTNDKAITWKTSLHCLEFSIHVNDCQSQRVWPSHAPAENVTSPCPSSPVMKLSCAFALDQDLFVDGSWRLVSHVGSLLVQDCSSSHVLNDYTNLLGPKQSKRDTWNEDQTFKLSGKTFEKTIWVRIARTNTFGPDGLPLGSSTRTVARVLPLEFVYVSQPIEALSHIGETFNEDFAEDYHRLSHSLTYWREKQKKRLLRALANKHKKLYIDVVIGAPVILIPENGANGSQLLVVDLGQLRFCDDSSIGESLSQFDDKWKLQITSVQMQRSPGPRHTGQKQEKAMQLVEPFSLDFAFWTRVSDVAEDGYSALLQATLPRLKVNITSSAVNMLRRLQEQWTTLRYARGTTLASISAATLSRTYEGARPVEDLGTRSFEVQFNAPILDIHLENDYDNLDVFDLSLKGISGRFEHFKGQDFNSSHFATKVHTLVVVDTFGSGRHDYSLLVSSVPTDLSSTSSSSDANFFDATSQGADLVCFEYDSQRSVSGRREDDLEGADKLSIRFHELFVNWNPQTISLIMRTLSGNSKSCSRPTEDTFFDAVEDKFYDAVDPSRPNSPSRSMLSDSLDHLTLESKNIQVSMLEVVFTMSKLRVNFNRDDRKRQVFGAEMTQTRVRYSTMINGGSRTFFTVGNLTLSDLSSSTVGTLYRDVLGLKTSGDGTSLVSVELIANIKARQYRSLQEGIDDPIVEIGKPLSIDEESGRVHGFDYYLSAKFSPMRFVYIQQVWFEVVDYFFAGIIGTEVWGETTTSISNQPILEGCSVEAESVSFTRFDVGIESPVILVPVHSCSPDYLQLDFSMISMKNQYSLERLRPANLCFRDGGNLQWYNTCSVELHRIRMTNGASRSDLNGEDGTPTAQLRLNWPTGPSALVNVPKWQVMCDVDHLDLRVDREDYAVFQNLVTYNLCESSRHMTEWEYFVSLGEGDRERFVNSAAVHFAYDLKDVLPSTFNCDIILDQSKIVFVDEQRFELVTLKSSRLKWNYCRMMDCVSHQTISCEPRLDAPDGSKIFSIDPSRFGPGQENYGFVYKSSTDKSGLNAKVLSAVAPTFIFPSTVWGALVEFFSDMVFPAYLDPEEAIQVGDRWYRIGDSAGINTTLDAFQSKGSLKENNVLPDYNLEVQLLLPVVNIGPDSGILLSSHALGYRFIRKSSFVTQCIRASSVYLGSTECWSKENNSTKLDLGDLSDIGSQPYVDSIMELDVQHFNIQLSPLLSKCLSELSTSVKKDNGEREVFSDDGTETSTDSIESIQNATYRMTKLSVHQLEIRVVSEDGLEGWIDECSLRMEDLVITRQARFFPVDQRSIASQVVTCGIRSVDVSYQTEGNPLLQVHPSPDCSASVNLSFKESIIDDKQETDLSLTSTVYVDLKPGNTQRLIDIWSLHFRRLSKVNGTRNEQNQESNRPSLSSMRASFPLISLSVYSAAGDDLVLELSCRHCNFSMFIDSDSSMICDLNVRDWSVFDSSSNLLRRTMNHVSGNDSSDAVVVNFAILSKISHLCSGRLPSWLEADVHSHQGATVSILALKMAPLVVSIKPENIVALMELVEGTSGLNEIKSPSSQAASHSLPLLVDASLSQTAVEFRSEHENGIVLAFKSLHAKRSRAQGLFSVEGLTACSLSAGQKDHENILSPIELIVEINDYEEQSDINFLIQEPLLFLLRPEQLSTISELLQRVGYRTGTAPDKPPKRITFLCVVESLSLDLSEAWNNLEVVQLRTKTIVLKTQWVQGITSLDLAINSLTIIDFSQPTNRQEDMLATVLVGDRTLENMRAEQNISESNPNVSVTAIITSRREVTIVLNHLRIAVLPQRLGRIVAKFASTSIIQHLTPEDSSSSSDFCLRLTCDGSEFIYSPDEYDTKMGMALNLALVARVDQAYDESHERSRSFSVNIQNAIASMIPDTSTLLRISTHSKNPRGDARDKPLIEKLAFSVELTQNTKNCNAYECIADVDPIVLRTSVSDFVLLRELSTTMLMTERVIHDGSGKPFRTLTVAFHSEKLGIALRRQGFKVVVDSLNDCSALKVRQGDCIYAINGEVVFDHPNENMAKIVDRLQSTKRPISITFCRPTTEEISPDRPVQGVDIRGEISVAGISLIMTETDIPLFCFQAKGSTVQFSRDLQSAREIVNCDCSSSLSLDYYNLRVWNWEPFFSPCELFLSISRHSDPVSGEDIAIEIGDRTCSLDFTSTDAFFETLKRATQRLYREPQITHNQVFHDAGEVEHKITQLANSLADQQTRGSQRHFVFRNRTGISLAFARSTQYKGTVNQNNELCAVGGYLGLSSYSPAEVSIVGSGEDLPFSLILQEESSTGRTDPASSCLGVTVALQEINGVSSQPFENLPLIRSNEVVLPLGIPHDDGQEVKNDWVTWSVDHVEDKCVVSMGTSLRVTSLIHDRVEIGVYCGSLDRCILRDVRRLATISLDGSYDLPLWLPLRKIQWHCFFRLNEGAPFNLLFSVSNSGKVSLRSSADGKVECKSSSASSPSCWLAIYRQDLNGICSIVLDSSISIRNLLPVPIDWQVKENQSSVIDGSVERCQTLHTGCFADVLCRQSETMFLRFRPKSKDIQWSDWTSVSSSRRTGSKNATPSVDEDDYKLTVHDYLKSLTIGVRVCKKNNGVDVVLYSDLWCVNCTRFDLVFGSQARVSSLPTNEQFDQVITSANEIVSTAEATLKEISSLFEPGAAAPSLRRPESVDQDSSSYTFRLPDQKNCTVVEESFEYAEVEDGNIKRKWWATENPLRACRSSMKIDEKAIHWDWIDERWTFDVHGETNEGWETSSNLTDFASSRLFNAAHRYRRRRWYRKRSTASSVRCIGDVNAYCCIHPTIKRRKTREGEVFDASIAVQVNGGHWSLLPIIPTNGAVYGVLRTQGSRWPATAAICPNDSILYELCYSISPLDGEFGLFSRALLVSSRFLIRNESEKFSYLVKPAQSENTSAIYIKPGEVVPFHWRTSVSDDRFCIRPVSEIVDYKWSWGIDPLTIGSVPVRAMTASETSTDAIRSIHVEVDIRPGSGGTGINISLKEESNEGNGSLFRIENASSMPIWIGQDISVKSTLIENGDCVLPSTRIAFGLTHPSQFQRRRRNDSSIQSGKLVVKVSLCPLSSTTGSNLAETIVLDATKDDERISLFPAMISFLPDTVREMLNQFVIVGTLNNDGPTRVLKLRLENARKVNEKPRWSPRRALSLDSSNLTDQTCEIIMRGAEQAVYKIGNETHIRDSLAKPDATMDETQPSKNLSVSFRASFSCFRVSFIDSCPAEVLVLTMENFNALATWDLLRLSDSTAYITLADLQIDNMIPNAPFPVAVSRLNSSSYSDQEQKSPLLVIGVSLAPRHSSGIVCFKSITLLPRDIAIELDIASLIRIQKYFMDISARFDSYCETIEGQLPLPRLRALVEDMEAAASAEAGLQKCFFGFLTILPLCIRLSVASPRALSQAQSSLLGPEVAAIHQAVRKGDILVGKREEGVVGVKIGSKNKTPAMVIQGMVKSFLLDGLLRLDGASMNFAGITLESHTASLSQTGTSLVAHYLAGMRKNLPSLVGSMAAIGNPLGLVRGLGEGVGDFVLEPARGLQRSVQEMDASHLVDGVARGTLSLARHTVGGFADSAAMLAETFSKNMTVLTLDRRYALKRDRYDPFRAQDDINVAHGIGSGAQKLARGFLDGVSGVVRAPIRGAEKRGLEGFAKGVGKGLLGLLVKPIIGISDGITDVMIGVKGTLDGASGQSSHVAQIRPGRAFYGRERAIRPYSFADAAASALMLQTRLAGEHYLNHMDMGNRVALLSVKRLVILGRQGQELLVLKLRHIESVTARNVGGEGATTNWGVIVLLNTPRQNGSEVEVILCQEYQAPELARKLDEGRIVAAFDTA